MKKLLAISLLAILSLSACGLFEKEENAQPEILPEINADTLLDNQIYENAVIEKDSGSCAKILNETKKKECENVVDAMNLTDKAVQKADDSYCDNIKLERYLENCEELVRANAERKELNEKAEQKDKENLNAEQEAVDNGDPVFCEKITDESRKNACKYNVLANQAIEKNDKTLCKNIGSEPLIANCEKQFE